MFKISPCIIGGGEGGPKTGAKRLCCAPVADHRELGGNNKSQQGQDLSGDRLEVDTITTKLKKIHSRLRLLPKKRYKNVKKERTGSTATSIPISFSSKGKHRSTCSK